MATIKDANTRPSERPKIDLTSLISSAELAEKKRQDNKEAIKVREAAGKAYKG